MNLKHYFFSSRALALLLFVVLSVTAVHAEYSDTYLNNLQAGFEARRDAVLASQVANPYPSTGGWNLVDFALAAIFRNERLDDANSSLTQFCDLYEGDSDLFSKDGNFHWTSHQFLRCWEFGHDGNTWFDTRLTPATETRILELIWAYGSRESKLSDAETTVSRTWYVWGSENHDIMEDVTLWWISKILKDIEPYKSQTYDDGGTPQQHYDAWTAYFKEYTRERARKGYMVEVHSNYEKYTLQAYHHFYDFSPDPELRDLAHKFLDLAWSTWASESIDLIQGGAKTRLYQQDAISGRAGNFYSTAWFYMNTGPELTKHPAFMSAITSTYRVPNIVMDMALDGDMGVYEIKRRTMGLQKELPVDGTYRLNPDYGGIVRYSYATPEFIIGSLHHDALTHDDWSAISDQNRWVGAIFKGDIDARIFPQCVGAEASGYKTYNQHWSAQSKGTLITQKLATSRSSLDMRVWFGSNGLNEPTTVGDWVICEAEGAWAAVRPASGGATWDPPEATGKWLRLDQEFSPVILEVACKADYPTFADFQNALASCSLNYAGSVLTYTGLYNDTFTFYTDYSQMPKINGETIDLRPARTFDSPYMTEIWKRGVVTIQKDSRELVLDFNETPPDGKYIYVNSATGDDYNNAATSFDDAYKTIGRAIEAWGWDVTGIRVAGGTYEEAFTLQDGAQVQGGYNPTDGSHDPANYPTIIDGGGLSLDHLISVNGVSGWQIEDVVVTGGWAAGVDDEGKRGGAFYMNGYSGTLKNCTFVDNRANYNGGAISVSSGVLYIKNCHFYDNFAGDSTNDHGGGALHAVGNARIHVSGSVFAANRAQKFGGALYIGSATSTQTQLNVARSRFHGNGYNNAYGALAFNKASLSLVNCIVSGNAAGRGSILHSEGPELIIANNTFHSNWTDSDIQQGHMRLIPPEGAEYLFLNNIFAQNPGAYVLSDFGAGLLDVRCNLFWPDGEGQVFGPVYDLTELNGLPWASDNIGADPLFTVALDAPATGTWDTVQVDIPSEGYTTLTDADGGFTDLVINGSAINPDINQNGHCWVTAGTSTTLVVAGDGLGAVTGSSYVLLNPYPQDSSPVLDAGQYDDAMPRNDFLGDRRPYGISMPDIGAYELPIGIVLPEAAVDRHWSLF